MTMASKTCTICNKGSQNGGTYAQFRATNFNPAGKRRRYPNLQWAILPEGGRIKICTRCKKANKHLTYKAE